MNSIAQHFKSLAHVTPHSNRATLAQFLHNATCDSTTVYQLTEGVRKDRNVSLYLGECWLISVVAVLTKCPQLFAELKPRTRNWLHAYLDTYFDTCSDQLSPEIKKTFNQLMMEHEEGHVTASWLWLEPISSRSGP